MFIGRPRRTSRNKRPVIFSLDASRSARAVCASAYPCVADLLNQNAACTSSFSTSCVGSLWIWTGHLNHVQQRDVLFQRIAHHLLHRTQVGIQAPRPSTSGACWSSSHNRCNFRPTFGREMHRGIQTPGREMQTPADRRQAAVTFQSCENRSPSQVVFMAHARTRR
jgi:hypothetical protein